LFTVRNNGRTPLIVSSNEAPIDIMSIQEAIINFDQHAVMSYNLREMAQDIPISQWQHYRMDELD
jgi:hypothetical protein